MWFNCMSTILSKPSNMTSTEAQKPGPWHEAHSILHFAETRRMFHRRDLIIFVNLPIPIIGLRSDATPEGWKRYEHALGPIDTP